MTRTGPYDEAFYAPFKASSAASARVIVPEIVALLHPTSVVDVGCGEGVWLAAFHDHGVPRIVGIDGDHVKEDRLHIPAGSFLVRDLSKALALPETFSLVVSLEVAEHLSQACADTFVNSLTGLGKAVLFSAAVPYQTGVNHVNLQWQDYWADLFAARGYVAVDAIRPIVWRNESVSFFYRQNMLLFVEENHLQAHPALVEAWERSRHAPLSIAHPQLVTHLGTGISAEQLDTLYLGQVIPRLPRMVIRAVAGRMSRLGARRGKRTHEEHGAR